MAGRRCSPPGDRRQRRRFEERRGQPRSNDFAYRRFPNRLEVGREDRHRHVHPWAGEQRHSRPLSARARRHEHAVYFLVDVEGDKNGQVEHFPSVSCAWADNGHYKDVVMSGSARVSNDRQKITDLRSDFDKAWWDDASDPSIRLVTFTPDNGERWDSPGKAVALVKMVVAAVTGAARGWATTPGSIFSPSRHPSPDDSPERRGALKRSSGVQPSGPPRDLWAAR